MSTAVGPLVDTHLHLWDPAPPELDGRTQSYSWMEGAGMPERSRPEDSLCSPGRDAGAQSVGAQAVGAQAVVVEADADDPAAEREWITALARTWPGILGYVAAIDLAASDWESSAAELAADPLVVGVRHNLEQRPLGSLAALGLGEKVGRLGELGLAFDVCVRAEQLGEAARELGGASGPVILDHLGKVTLGERAAGANPDPALARWREDLLAFAALPASACKVSGLWSLLEAPQQQQVADAAWRERAVASAAERIAVVLECFGPDRMLLGSDHPVSTLARGLDRDTALAMTLEAIGCSGGTAPDPARLDATARRVYRLASIEAGRNHDGAHLPDPQDRSTP